MSDLSPLLGEERKSNFGVERTAFGPRPDIPLVAIKVMNLGDGYQARCPNEPVLQRCNDPGSTLMRGSFPSLARY